MTDKPNTPPETLRFWEAMRTPPDDALGKITGGRLGGKTNINPQWRYEAMTRVFGPCGFGWRYVVGEPRMVPAHDGQVFVFVDVDVFYRIPGTTDWSEAVRGVGGSMLLEKESKGMFSNDEAVKMAVTDALGTALKMLGVAADVYLGMFDNKYGGGKHRADQSQRPPEPGFSQRRPPQQPAAPPASQPAKVSPSASRIPPRCPNCNKYGRPQPGTDAWLCGGCGILIPADPPAASMPAAPQSPRLAPPAAPAAASGAPAPKPTEAEAFVESLSGDVAPPPPPRAFPLDEESGDPICPEHNRIMWVRDMNGLSMFSCPAVGCSNSTPFTRRA